MKHKTIYNRLKIIKPLIFAILVIGLVLSFSGCDIREILTGETGRDNQIEKLSKLRPEDIKPAIVRIIEWGAVAGGSVAGLYFIIGGFHYMVALGNEEKLEKAKNTVFFAVVGMIIILLAYVFVKFLLSKIAAPGTLD